MQAGSVNLAAEGLRKKRHRRWRAKGRIERQASTESGMRTSTVVVIRNRAKPVAGSYGLERPGDSDAVFWPCMPAGEQAA